MTLKPPIPRRWQALLPPMVAALIAWAAPAAGQEKDLVIGILAPEGEEEAAADWAGVAEHLSRSVPGARFRPRYFDLPGLREAVTQGSVDFFVSNPGHYVALEITQGAHRLATLDRSPDLLPTAAIASAVVVPAGRRDLTQLRDLRGQRVLAVSEEAFGGYQVAWRELKRLGVDPRHDFASLRFVGFPLQRLLKAVADGEADAAIVRACVLEAMVRRGEIGAETLRVLPAPAADSGAAAPYPCRHTTARYPDWPFAAVRATPHALSKQVAIALLGMPGDGDQLKWTIPTDYQSVHALFRELQIGPYAPLAEPSLAGLAARYRGWIVGALLFLLAWLAHSLRAEHLVRQRTRSLRDAQAARLAAEQEARAQREKLDHLARLGMLGELSSLLAHELNQPLAAIGSFARGMERRIENRGHPDDEGLLTGSREIAEQAERARDIMQRIRAFAGKRAGQRRRQPLAAIVDTALRLFAAIGDAAPAIACDIDRGIEADVDRLQIELVLLNLIKNAFDATQTLPPAERRITLRLQRAGEMAQLCVVDNGGGVAAEERSRLFEPFFTTKPDGLGLGLSLCKSIVEAHGGALSAADAPEGRGLAVCCSLPLSPQKEDVKEDAHGV